MLSGRTYLAFLFSRFAHCQREEVKIINLSFPPVEIEPTTVTITVADEYTCALWDAPIQEHLKNGRNNSRNFKVLLIVLYTRIDYLINIMLA